MNKPIKRNPNFRILERNEQAPAPDAPASDLYANLRAPYTPKNAQELADEAYYATQERAEDGDTAGAK